MWHGGGAEARYGAQAGFFALNLAAVPGGELCVAFVAAASGPQYEHRYGQCCSKAPYTLTCHDINSAAP